MPSDEYAADFKRTGFRGQLGYFVLPAKLEVVARYAKIQRLRAEDQPDWRVQMKFRRRRQLGRGSRLKEG